MKNNLESQLQALKSSNQAPASMTLEAFSTLRACLYKDKNGKQESPYDMYKRVARTAANIYRDVLNYEDVYEDFFHVISNNWLGLSTPIAANLGTPPASLPISCFVSSVSDSINGIFDSLHEASMLTKAGGGVGIDLTSIRPQGDSINGGGNSNGAKPWATIFDIASGIVSQAGVRRGQFSFNIDIESPDLWDFLLAKDHSKGDPRKHIHSNICVNVTDKFMSKLYSNDVSAINIWNAVLRTRLISGSPYLHFIDNANRDLVQCMKDKGFKITGTNICCFEENTLVLTKKGSYPIKELVGKTVEIYDGANWVSNSNFSLSGKSKLIQLTLKNGEVLKLTPNHRCLIESNGRVKTPIGIEAQEIKIGQKLFKSNVSSTEGFKKLKGAYAKGFLLGDGTSSSGNKPILNVHFPKFDCIDRILLSLGEIDIDQNLSTKAILVPTASDTVEILNTTAYGRQIFKKIKGLNARKSTLFDWTNTYRINSVNLSEYNRESRLELLSGYFDADGCSFNGHIQCASADIVLLNNIRDCLFSLGYRPSISVCKTQPNGHKQTHRLYITRYESYQLLQELSCQRLSYDVKEPNRECFVGNKVVAIDYLEGEHDVYCTKVPSTSYFTLANGVLIGNTEISSCSTPDYTMVCCLASENLYLYDFWKHWKGRLGKNLHEIGILFLDAVMENFINETANIKRFPKFERARAYAINGRPLGLGVFGYHAYLMKNNWAFDSEEATEFNNKFFASMNSDTNRASFYLADLIESAPWANGRGNIQLTAIAPTVGNSVVNDGVSPGIEPLEANYYVADGASGSFKRKNPILERLLDQRGYNTHDIWESILTHVGSVQHLSSDILSDHEKEVFKTFNELDQRAIIKAAAARQPYLEQTQSVNLSFNLDADAEYISDVHLMAEQMGMHSLYYLRSESVQKKALRAKEDRKENTESDSINNGTDYFQIVTKEGCIWCDKSIELLKELNSSYTKFPRNEENKFKVPDNYTTYPKILKNGKFLGGYNELREYLFINGTVSEGPESCSSCDG